MAKLFNLRLIAVSIGLFLAAPISAATLQVNGSGILTGATAVNVNGVLYDVTFVDGTCADLFSGCDQTSDFAFQDSSTALAAAQALLNQVFLDGPAGNFDSDVTLTFGCNTWPLYPPTVCDAFVPYGFDNGNILFEEAHNGPPYDNAYSSFAYLGYDTSSSETTVYARFTPSAVPEPSSWEMLLLGFGAIGAMMRRKRRTDRLTQIA